MTQPSIQPGVTRTQRITIDESRTISFLGEELRIYSTPSMVRDVEHTCLELVRDHLEAGSSSVGIHVMMDHLGATPLGQWVDVEVTVSAVDGRRITMLASVRDAVEQVGRGEHIRFVIDVDKHRVRLEKKLEKLNDA